MNDKLLAKINTVLTCYYEELIGSVKDNDGIVGEYFNELNNDPPRLLCQTRSIFFLVKFYEIFNDRESLELAQSIYKKTRHIYKINELWSMRVGQDEPLDLYGFASLAYAEVMLYQSTGFQEFAQYSDETLDFLVNIILSEDFDVESSVYQNRISQNPLMHLFESFVFAYQVLQKESYKEAALKILDVVYQNFYNAENGAIMEVLFETDMPCWYEPGHLFEWGSLLKVARKQGITFNGIAYDGLIGLAESITEKFDYMVPAKVYIAEDEIENIYRIWASLERMRIHFLLGNSQLGVDGVESILAQFFDSNNLPIEFREATNSKVKSTTGYHIINCFDEAIKWIKQNS